MRLRIAKIQRIDYQSDIGRILAGLPYVRDFDQLEIGLMHAGLERLVSIPITVGLLDHDAALGQQSLENGANIELVIARITDA